ncbi:MAG: hypothetical protein V3U76_07130 [Granulosicoccus sp.]
MKPILIGLTLAFALAGCGDDDVEPDTSTAANDETLAGEQDQPLPDTGLDSIDELLVNVQAGDDPDGWLCDKEDSGNYLISFWADGNGVRVARPNGLPFTWEVSGDTVMLSVESADDSFIGGIVFSGEDAFTSETSNFIGFDAGPLSCNRVHFNQ